MLQHYFIKENLSLTKQGHKIAVSTLCTVYSREQICIKIIAMTTLEPHVILPKSELHVAVILLKVYSFSNQSVSHVVFGIQFSRWGSLR